jgi:deoxyadenosine/deoxycytidine kinase
MKIAIGGMIASGKSTLVDLLSQEFNLAKMDEFDQADDVFNTLLKWLYEGKENVEMLLQIYFLHKHWMSQKALKDNVIIDRHIIEHWLFAQINLAKTPEVLNMYNGLFHQYMNSITHPDLYIILDMDWESFKERIMKRGRVQEIENFGHNENYFKYLMDGYVRKLKAQCEIYNIPSIVIDTSGMDEESVFDAAAQIIDIITKEGIPDGNNSN